MLGNFAGLVRCSMLGIELDLKQIEVVLTLMIAMFTTSKASSILMEHAAMAGQLSLLAASTLPLAAIAIASL